jgi:branched-chain amino acid transport system substrate-binding protein
MNVSADKMQATRRARAHSRPKLFISAAAGLSGTVLLAACATGASATSSGIRLVGGQIPVGMVAPLTGIGGSAGVGALEGAEAAISQINALGGVLGHKVDLIIGNDNTDPVDAVPVVEKQISIDRVVASYGPAANTWPATRHYYDAAGVPVIVWGGEDDFPHLKDPLVYRDTPADSQLGVAMAVGAWELGYRRAAMLFGTDTNGAALGATVKAAWTKLGGKIVANVSFTPGETSYRSEVQRIVSAHPQVILFRLLSTDAGTMFSALNELTPGGLSIPMVGDDTSDQTDFTKAIGLAASKKVVNSIDTGVVTGPGVTLFNKIFQTEFGTPPLSQANFAYDGLNMIALAIEKARSTSGPAIAKAIAEIENPANMPVYSFAQGLAALKAGKNIKYVGVSGPLNFDQYHHVFGPFAVYRSLNTSGSLQRILEITPAELQAATP